jgi:hypothetical protein
MTATLWGSSDRKARDTLRYLFDKALLTPGPTRVGGTPSYRLHDLFHDLARRLLTAPRTTEQHEELPGLGLALPEAHAALLGRYRGRTRDGLWHTLPDDGYIHGRLIWHLEQAGQANQIHAVLCEEDAERRSGWYEANERLGQGWVFSRDVNRAWRLVSEAQADSCSQVVGLQCRYALMAASLNSMAENTPPTLLAALVRGGNWSVIQGIAHAGRIPDARKRAEAFLALVSLVPDVDLPGVLRQALAAARATQDDGQRAEALMWVVPYLQEPERSDVLRQALVAARAIEDGGPRIGAGDDELRQLLAGWAEFGVGGAGGRAEALTRVARHLPEPERNEVLREELERARAIRGDGERASQLASLTPHLPLQLLPEAMRLVWFIGDDQRRAWALGCLILRQAQLGRPLDALREARRITEDRPRSSVLAELTSYLPGDKRNEVLLEALQAAGAIPDEWHRSQQLESLAPHLPLALLPEALAAARGIGDERLRAGAQVSLLRRQAELGRVQEALGAARGIGDNGRRAEALADLALRLPEGEQAGVVREALQAARAVWDTRQRAEALRHVAPRLSEVERGGVLHEALEAVRVVEEESARGLDAAQLAPHLPVELLPEALEVVLSINAGPERASALRVLAPYLPPPLLSKALDAARSIPDPSTRDLALDGLIPHLPPPLLAQALDAVRPVRDLFEQTSALIALAPGLTEEGRDRALRSALEATRAFQDVNKRTVLVERLSPLLPESVRDGLLREVLGTVLAIRDGGNRTLLWSLLVPHLAADVRDEAVRQVLEGLQGVEDLPKRAWVIGRLAPQLKEAERDRLLRRALKEVQDESQGWNRAQSLHALSTNLSEEMLPEALLAVQGIGDEQTRAEALVGLLRRQAQLGRVQQALGAARGIGDDGWRAQALAEVTPHLPQEERAGVTRQALATARAIPDQGARVAALARVLPQLTELSPADLYRSWLEMLRSSESSTRKQLLEHLAAQAPVLSRLGEVEAVDQTARAIQDLSRWWP